jgi:hypothetical protein
MIIIKNSQKTRPTWRRVLQWYNTNLREESSLLELLRMIDKYRGIKMTIIKKFAEGYLGYNLTNTEFNDMFNW